MNIFRTFVAFGVLSSATFSFATDYQNRDCYDIYDPLQRVNRKTFMVNGALDYVFVRPVARGYTNLVPEKGRSKVNNFVVNFYTPVTFVNNILQLDFKEAMKSFWKFTFNTTFGVLGFHDLTTPRGLEVKKQTFGSTLAYYGARPGAYVVLPIYGSTNMRDMLDVLTFDKYFNPVTYNIPTPTYTDITIAAMIHQRSVILPFTENVTKTSLDPYVTIRTVLYQKREGELNYPERYKCIQNPL
jgi:phospholipid-binding lipoprotein MlaA